jgi:Leucine-rich repeat (LRR) protein
MRCFATLLLLGFIGCNKPPAPSATEPTPQPVAATTPLADSTNEVEKLEKALAPIEWYVNDLPNDAKPRLVQVPIVRSRWEKKTEQDFAKLSKVLEETGVPVLIDLGGYQGTPATASWVKHIVGNRMVLGFCATSGFDAKEAIPELAKMTWLESLEIGSESLTDVDIAPLAALTKLKSLILKGSKNALTRASYAVLAKMSELRKFNLEATFGSDLLRATDEDIAILASLTKLESLSIKVDAPRTTDAGLARLKTLTGLRSLSIESGQTQLSGPRTVAVFDAIGGMTDLEELKLQLLAPSEGLTKLASLKKLRKLTVQTRNYFGGEPLVNFMRHIGKLNSLEEIDLEHGEDPLTDEALSFIKGLTNLRVLEVGGSQVTDEGLKYLSDMKELVRLWCRANPVTGSGFKYLGGLTKLEFVSLNMGKVTDDGLANLSTLPNLRVLDLFQTNITDAGLKHLIKCPKLENLGLAETGITDNGVTNLVKCPKLVSLDLAKTGITDACVPALKLMPFLKGIDARKTKLTLAAAAELKDSGKLKWVTLE